jgi:hypothetical protein
VANPEDPATTAAAQPNSSTFREPAPTNLTPRRALPALASAAEGLESNLPWPGFAVLGDPHDRDPNHLATNSDGLASAVSPCWNGTSASGVRL